MLTVLLVALSVGLDNFAGSIGIGLSGLDARVRVRVALVFGAFESGMPMLGLLLSHSIARTLGSHAQVIGGVILALTGLYGIVTGLLERRHEDERSLPSTQGFGRLLATATALSIDNLAIGFALGTYHVALIETIVTIGVVSVVLSLIGLELGSRIGMRIGEYGELFGGAVLVVLGILLGVGAI